MALSDCIPCRECLKSTPRRFVPVAANCESCTRSQLKAELSLELHFCLFNLDFAEFRHCSSVDPPCCAFRVQFLLPFSTTSPTINFDPHNFLVGGNHHAVTQGQCKTLHSRRSSSPTHRTQAKRGHKTEILKDTTSH